jgi:hypothetical protein
LTAVEGGGGDLYGDGASLVSTVLKDMTKRTFPTALH